MEKQPTKKELWDKLNSLENELKDTTAERVALEKEGNKTEPEEKYVIAEPPTRRRFQRYNFEKEQEKDTPKTPEEIKKDIEEKIELREIEKEQESKNSIRIPLMITHAMEEKLKHLGLNEDEIKKLTPEEAWKVIDDELSQKKMVSEKGQEEDIVNTKPRRINFLDEEEKDILQTPEEKIEEVLNKKENDQKKSIESSKFKSAFEKTEKWWKGLDDSRKGKALKAGMGALFITSTTIAAGSLLGIAPSSTGGIFSRVLMRTAGAMGLNMAATSNLTKHLFFAKGMNKEERKGWKKHLNWEDLASILGIGGSALLTGGLSVPLIGLAGYSSKKITNAVFNNKIEKLEKEGEEENKNKIKKLKKWKSIINGAETIGVGLGTMAVLHHETEVKADEIKQEKEIRNQAELERQGKLKEQEELKQQEELRAEIEERIKLNDAMVKDGEGIEHSFIRQIEHNPELAQKLGFDGDINDTKALHEFAGKEAHILAIKTGYVDGAGHEIRIMEANKVAYEIKIENEQVVIEEKNVEGELLETHHEGDKFEETADKYERNYTAPEEKKDTSDIDYQEIYEQAKPKGLEMIKENEEPMSEYEEVGEKTEKNTVSDQNFKTTEHENISKKQLAYEDLSKNTTTESPVDSQHLSNKDLEQVKELHDTNINNIIHIQSLNSENIQKIESTLNEGHADAMIGIEKSFLNTIYQPLYSYMNKLYKITDLKPISETPIQSAETNIDYIHRAEMKVAEMRRLEEIKPDYLLHFLTQEKEIILPKNEHFPLITEPIKAHFFYDKDGDQRGFSMSDTKIEGFRDNAIFKDDFRKSIIEWNEKHSGGDLLDENFAINQEIGLYINLAAYDNISENSDYLEEAELLKSAIIDKVNYLQKFGDIIDFDKLPEKFEQFKPK